MERRTAISKLCEDDLSEQKLTEISTKVNPKDWKKLGRLLGLEEKDLDRIEYDNRNYNVDEIIFQTLLTWKQMKGSAATGQQLQRVLVDMYEVEDEEKISFRLSEILQRLQRLMTGEYIHLELPRVPWLKDKIFPMKDLFVELTITEKNLMGTTDKRDVKLKNIFVKSESSETPKRILIEGDPGFGKTTLALKLAYDWAAGESYIRDKFEIVFVILLRYFKEDVNEMLCEQYCPEGTSQQELLDVITFHQAKILLILDGFDEIDEEKKKCLHPLLMGNIYSQMTVLVTSRTGETEMQLTVHSERYTGASRAALSAFTRIATAAAYVPVSATVAAVAAVAATISVPDGLFHIGAKRHETYSFNLWDIRIQIKGVSEENRKNFLQAYLEEDLDKCKELLSRFVTTESEILLKCPLFLQLIMIFVEDNEIESINNITDLYKRVVNYAIRRSLQKENLIEVDEEIDLFNFEEKNCPAYMKVLMDFACLSLNKLLNNSFLFTSEELQGSIDDQIKIKQLGFLTRNISFEKHRFNCLYEPVHKSFIEFFASYFVSKIHYKTQKFGKTFEFECYANDNHVPLSNSLYFKFLKELAAPNYPSSSPLVRMLMYYNLIPISFQYFCINYL